KQYANLFNTLKSIKGSYPEQTFDKIEQSIQKNLARIKELNKAYQQNGKLTDEQKKEYISLKKQLDQLSASFATTRAETDKLQKSNKLALPNVNNLRKGLANLLTTIQSTSKNYPKGTFDSIATEATRLQNSLLKANQNSPLYAKRVTIIKDRLANLQTQFAETKASATNFHGSLKDIVGGFLKFQLAAMVVMKPIQLLRDAWNSLNETVVKTEDAVISLQRVLNNTNLSNSDISNKLYDLAIQYGQTFDNVNDIAQNFARTGMSWNETIQATASALLALNVAELDATQASDGMIAIMQQFGYEASDLTSIIDMLNKTADNYAVTTDKLLTALQRTGSSAKNAGMDLKETIGVISALSEATGRSGENIGTAVNSLIQYSRKDTALDTFASLSDNTSSVVGEYRKGNGSILDVWKAVSAEIQNLTSEQADKLDRYFNTEDGSALKDALGADLGEIYEDLEGVYDTANTFRKNYFIALLGNMDTVEDAIQTASDASGYSQKENEKYLDSYTAKVTALDARWQKLVNDDRGFLGFKKGLVDIGNFFLNIVDFFGGVQGALNVFIATMSPFLIKWTIVFGTKAIAATTKAFVNFFFHATTGAQKLNAALGWIGIALGLATTVFNAIDSANRKAQEAQQEWIDATSQSSSQALSYLDEIKNKVKETSEEYLNLSKKATVYTGELSK
ncbi:MAG: phage tail tape measure protein, partial [Clostridia bacterium]|nr:phage tail tape measure protein [Clostridia bacterium]